MASTVVKRARSARRTALSGNPLKAASPQGLERASRLLQAEIDYISNSSFLADDAESAIPAEEEVNPISPNNEGRLSRELPSHLGRLCESRLLSAEEEARLFRRMNFAKFQADALRRALDRQRPDRATMDRIEQLLTEAEGIRDRILQANMRLVMSIVKKFVTPQHSFDDMLSDGIYSLMQAVEKFDYDRGFRFSTYAYRAIARNAYRSIADRQKENARAAGNSEEIVVNAEDERGSSSVADEAWDRLRGLLAQLMERLDRREQFIIRSRYALGAHRKVRSLRYLADRLGVSKERARQLEQRALGKLKTFASEEALEDLVGVALS